MGTRSVTKVISGGKVRLCQFGQWGGYPTYAGVKILEWIKKGDFDAIKECELHVNEDGEMTATGYPYDNEIAKMSKEYSNKVFSKQRHSYTYTLDADEEMLEEFGEDAYIKFKLSHSSTGADILNIITKPVRTYADERIAGLNGTDREIEAFNVINLDEEVVRMKWHDKEDAWTFGGIKKINIERTMERFEEE